VRTVPCVLQYDGKLDARFAKVADVSLLRYARSKPPFLCCKEHATFISFDCPGCGQKLEVNVASEEQMRLARCADGTAEVWQHGELHHACDPAVSRHFHELSPGTGRFG